MSEVLLCTTKTGRVELDVNLADEAVWLSINQMAELFGRDKSAILRNLDKIFEINELDRISAVAKYATVQKEGDPEVKRDIEYYNLDAIISVGYRVNSKNQIKTRKQA